MGWDKLPPMTKTWMMVAMAGTLLASGLRAETWRTETLVGTGKAGRAGDGGPALQAETNNPFGVVRGPDGLIYFCEYDGHLIRRILKDGTVETIAGTGKAGYSGDGGPALQADMNKPHEIRFDAQGDLYFTDMMNHVIRRIDMKTRTIHGYAGTGVAGFSGDGGPALQAQLKQPHSIQFGPDGRLYICDIGNHRVRVVNPKDGTILTLVGNGKRDPIQNGASFDQATLNGPRTLDFDREGHLWLALREGNQVLRLDLRQRRVFHVAGTGKKGFSGHGGPALEATLSGPKGIAIAPDGRIWLADTESHSIRVIDPKTGLIHLVAGTGKPGDGPDGGALKCQMDRPHGVFVEEDGTVLIGDSQAHRVRRMVPVK